MKIKSLAAFIIAAAVIVFISCNWLTAKENKTTNPLIGSWKMDSLKVGKDSSFINYLLLASIEKDTSSIDFRFSQDTLFTHSQNDVDTTFYRFDEKLKRLLAKEDSIETVYSFSRINDSIITLTSQDSSMIFLKKK